MTTEARLIALAEAMAGDIKILKAVDGNLEALTTSTKTSLVAAINELVTAIGGAGAQILDTAGDGDILVTWSANKIYDELELAKQNVKDSILGGAAAAFDTLKELQEAINSDASFAATVAAGLNNRVRFDAAQVLTGPQKTQALDNIGAASTASVVTVASDLSALSAALGDTNKDLVAVYTAAKA